MERIIHHSLPLRVAFITKGYPVSYRTNAGIFTHRSIKFLSNYLQVSVLHIRSWKPGRLIVEHGYWDGVKVIRMALPQLPSRRLLDFNASIIKKLGMILVKPYLQDVDLFHSTGVYPTAYYTDYWAKTLGKAHIAQAVGSDVNLFLPQRIKKTGSWIRSIDGFMCNSNALKELLDLMFPGLSNIKVIYRGVDTCFFTPQGEVIGPQVGFPPVKFIYLGGFQTWSSKDEDKLNTKGGHILLEAWKIAETQLGNSSLLIAGDGVNFSRLDTWKSTLNKPDNIFGLKTIQPNEVPALIRSSDVVVIPSMNEGLPNLANEAQACERPVLGTDAGGIPEAVSHGETGLIVSRGDPQALAQGLLWFYNNQNKIHSMGRNGCQNINQKFSWENYASETVELFQNTLALHVTSSLSSFR